MLLNVMHSENPRTRERRHDIGRKRSDQGPLQKPIGQVAKKRLSRHADQQRKTEPNELRNGGERRVILRAGLAEAHARIEQNVPVGNSRPPRQGRRQCLADALRPPRHRHPGNGIRRHP